MLDPLVTTTETPLDLDAIEADMHDASPGSAQLTQFRLIRLAMQVPGLVAEVKRLRARVENHHCGGRDKAGA